MKRLNPITNEPFKRGDIREDGYIFNNYASPIKKDGYFKEVWLTSESLHRRRLADSRNKMKNYKKISARVPKGTRSFFKRDFYAKDAYRQAMGLIREYPDYTKEELDECVELAPYVLKIIFPDPNGVDYKEIFKEGEGEIRRYEEAKRLTKQWSK